MRSGVVIVQDYIGMPQQPGNQVVHADEASWMAEVMKSESVLEPSIFGGEGEAVRPCNFHFQFWRCPIDFGGYTATHVFFCKPGNTEFSNPTRVI